MPNQTEPGPFKVYLVIDQNRRLATSVGVVSIDIFITLILHNKQPGCQCSALLRALCLINPNTFSNHFTFLAKKQWMKIKSNHQINIIVAGNQVSREKHGLQGESPKGAIDSRNSRIQTLPTGNAMNLWNRLQNQILKENLASWGMHNGVSHSQKAELFALLPHVNKKNQKLWTVSQYYSNRSHSSGRDFTPHTVWQSIPLGGCTTLILYSLIRCLEWDDVVRPECRL